MTRQDALDHTREWFLAVFPEQYQAFEDLVFKAKNNYCSWGEVAALSYEHLNDADISDSIWQG